MSGLHIIQRKNIRNFLGTHSQLLVGGRVQVIKNDLADSLIIDVQIRVPLNLLLYSFLVILISFCLIFYFFSKLLLLSFSHYFHLKSFRANMFKFMVSKTFMFLLEFLFLIFKCKNMFFDKIEKSLILRRLNKMASSHQKIWRKFKTLKIRVSTNITFDVKISGNQSFHTLSRIFLLCFISLLSCSRKCRHETMQRREIEKRKRN